MALKILGKMSLENFENKPRRKSPEYYAPEMKSRIQEMADKVNEKYGNILDKEGRVRVEDEDDLKYVRIKEEAWARERGMSLDTYLEKQEKNKSSLAESAISLSMAKVLGDRFLSIRSSSYDDYENGIDNLLMDTESGNLICGFDEVVEGYNQNGQDIKEEKIMKKFKSGGSYAKYGLKLEGEKITISKQKNLPTFYISLNKDELSDLLENISKPEVTEVEKNVLQDIVHSLEYQIDKMGDKNINIPEDLKNNLENTKSFIETLKEKI